MNAKTSIAATIAFLLMGAAGASAAPWTGVWGASPTPPSAVRMGPMFATASYSGQTLRQIVRVSDGGTSVRLRISNEYGARPLQIGSVHLALAGAGGAIQPGTDHAVTFGGASTVQIPPGAPLVSDPVAMPVSALQSLAVSIYLPADTGPCTCHPTGAATGFASVPGDFSAAVSFPVQSTFQTRAFLTGVDVSGPPAGDAIVTLGDSITDGAVSTPDANKRWPDRLAERLIAAGLPYSVVNAGISGNRVLANGAGDSALARFDRDVLAVPGVKYVIVFEGINDLGIGHMRLSGPMAAMADALPKAPAGAEDIIGGYKQLIARAHEHGLRIFGATITPYGGAAYYSAEGEADREKINAWIRTSGAFDGVIDFDAAWRDPADPTRIRNAYQAGDHLHGSDLGYRVLGDAVDLSLFR